MKIQRIVAFIVMAALALLTGMANTADAGTVGHGHPGRNRIATWGASPVRLDAPVDVADRTVRNLIHTSVGGPQAQVVLSNVFGDGPVTFDAATIGVQTSGAGVARGSLHTLTFGGRPTVTLQPGAQVTSDPLAWSVPADTTLAISLQVSGSVGAVTGHAFAGQTSYVSQKGNATRDLAGTSYSTTISSWYWVDDLTVRAPHTASTLAFFGDSITDGVDSTKSANLRWPDQLADRLAAAPHPHRYGVLNEGISANRLLDGSGGNAGYSGLSRFERDVLDQPGVSRVFVLEGVNDLRWDLAQKPADLIAAYRTLIAEAHARGICVTGATILPFGGSDRWTAQRDAVRMQVNDWIRTSGQFDTVVDFDAALRDPDDPSVMRPGYAGPDHLHPSDDGYRRMAATVDLATLSCRRATT